MSEELAGVKEFVLSVYKTPILWNNKRVDFKSHDKKEAQWGRIGREFGISGEDAKQKFCSLRQKYIREKKIVKNERRNGKNVWYLLDSLKFLDQVIMPRKTELSLRAVKYQPPASTSESTPTSSISPIPSTSSCTLSPYTDELYIGVDPEDIHQSSIVISPPEIKSSPQSSIVIAPPEIQPNLQTNNVTPQKTPVRKPTEPVDDDWPNVSPEVKIYCKYLGTLLMNVPPEKMLEVQAKIFQTIFNTNK